VTIIEELSGKLALIDPDTRLMLEVRDDEPSAFEKLVRRYQHRLVGVMHHLVGDAAEAEDLAQEIFLRVYRARKTYRARCKFSTWLFTIANNMAVNSLRARQRRPMVPLRINDEGPLGPRPTEHLVLAPAHQPGQRLQQEELAVIVRQALEGLNARQRVAVVLNKYEDMDYAEIGAVMGLSTKAVKSLLCRARVNLRAALRPYMEMTTI
jgi:RNA polymerase sigma-70 factor (ECF subfamily)